MNDLKQPEVLRLAKTLESLGLDGSADLIRMQHYRIVELEAQLEALEYSIGAGGVENLRKREQIEPLCWVNEDELPESMTDEAYAALLPYSKIDGVRMFPIYGSAASRKSQAQQDARDAARYRWLRSQPNDVKTPRIDVVHWVDNGDVNNGEGLRLYSLDEAIDAARDSQGTA